MDNTQPYKSQMRARRAAAAAGHEVVPVDGGFELRAPAAKAAAPVEDIGRLWSDGKTADFWGAVRNGSSKPPSVDDLAHEAATSPNNDHPEPTEAQKKAGNYVKGHCRIGGLDISCENPAGSVRSGTAKDGTQWQTEMQDHYGYVKGSTGADKDHVDVFIKAGTPADYSGPVFVVDQVEPETGEFDEAKCMIGYASEEEASEAYRSNYSADWDGLGAITMLPWPAFRAWVKSSEAKRPLGTLKDTPEDGDGLGQPADAGRPAGAEPPDPGAGAGTGAVVPGELPSEPADRVAA
jgi:hypothetical protein